MRAIEVLKTVDVVAAEDTRHSGILLKHLGLEAFRQLSRAHEATRTPELVEGLARGENVALITDAVHPACQIQGSV
jgi:16S rRNA (cytidine1402-2'-O)-methyltransferase